MNAKDLTSIDQLTAFLEGTQRIAFEVARDKDRRYQLIQRTLAGCRSDCQITLSATDIPEQEVYTVPSPMPSRRSKSRKSPDPFAEREAEFYANPIASREFILEQLEQIGEPVAFEVLRERLQLTDAEQVEALRRRLTAMSRDGQIISNRRGVYGLAAHMDLHPGRVQGNKDGFGFFIPDDQSDDLFLNAREMAKLFDGDRVLARLSGFDNRGRKEGMVAEILERRYTGIVGRYYRDHGVGIVIPDSKRVPHEILIPDRHAGNARDGQFVVAAIKEYPSARRKAIAHITEVLGDVTTPGLEIEVALRSHDIPFEWPAPVKKQTTGLPQEVTEKDLAGRFDLRHIPFVTIDGEDAKDFDDAVFCHRHQRGNWTLYVAIADVAHYVPVSSALDEEATNRGSSVYFPGHVVPMLPEKLSNGLCSLKPEVDRLAMVCEMEISAAGIMTDYSFYEAVIHSHARLTYTEVADMVQPPGNDSEQRLQARLRKRRRKSAEHLDNLYSLYHALRRYREDHGALDFETIETRIVFGEDRKIREILPVTRNEAHRLIEECMLCANVAAAQLLEEADLPALYRIHEGPNPDKLANLREFLGELGLHLGGGEKPAPTDYARVLTAIANRPDRHLLQTVLIRSMMQAVYQPDNIGHFGLGFPAYTHFTSPIRRYPDLLVHRAIRYLVRNKTGVHLQRQADARPLTRNQIYPYTRADMDALGASCSAAERRADAAGYAVVDWLKCEYMQDHVGDDFRGTISAVTGFGLFVELTDIYIEGLVHVTELTNDYYHFDPVRHCLEGERTHNIYRLGDSVEVKVVRVDLDEKKIDLQMLGNHSARRDRAASKSKRKQTKQLKKSSSKENLKTRKVKPKSRKGELKSGKEKSKSRQEKPRSQKAKPKAKKTKLKSPQENLKPRKTKPKAKKAKQRGKATPGTGTGKRRQARNKS